MEIFRSQPTVAPSINEIAALNSVACIRTYVPPGESGEPISYLVNRFIPSSRGRPSDVRACALADRRQTSNRVLQMHLVRCPNKGTYSGISAVDQPDLPSTFAQRWCRDVVFISSWGGAAVVLTSGPSGRSQHGHVTTHVTPVAQHQGAQISKRGSIGITRATPVEFEKNKMER